MSFQNAGAIADELSNLFSVKPEIIADIMENVVINGIYGKTMIVKYRHNGIDPITGKFDPTKKEICSCRQKEFGSYGVGIDICKICNGAGVKGGWISEEFKGFFWLKLPSGLKNFSKIFSLTLPIERADGVIYISANEDYRKFDEGNYVIVNMSDENTKEDNIEFQIMTCRPVVLSHKVLWRQLIVTKQPVQMTKALR